MATPQQIELAKKYYTQEQINQEMANPWSVKRVDAIGTPTYEQPVNGQFASASTAPTTPAPKIPDVWQQSNWVNAQGETIYNFWTITTPRQTPTVPPWTPTIPNAPVPWSVSSILGEWFWAEDPFVSQYYKDQLSQYNQTIDPQAAYNEQLAQRQAQIDATNALYRDQLNQARIQGQWRLGSGRAIQARGWLLGSSFGAAQTNQIQSANTDIENAIEQERLAVVNQIMTNARSSAAADIAEKRAAKEAGWKAYLEYLAWADTRKKEKVSKAAQLLLSLGKSPQDISDEELKQAGISRQDLTMEYTTGKSAQEAAATTAELDQAKKIAEIEKLNADIAKGQLDASKYYEVGNRIYEQGTNRYVWDAAFNPYSGAMQVTPWNSVYNPVTNTFTQAPGGSFSTNAPAGWFRTDRHNNPTAMTTDVARTLGLVEGVDYTKWDPFPNNPNLFTARLNGDPIQTTIKALDLAAQDPNKSAFRTQGGQPRWTYIDMTDQQWNSMTPEQKTATITKMYQNEWGTGALVGGGGWLSDLAQSVQKGIITIAQIPVAQRAAIAQELARSGAETPKTQEIQRNIDLVDSLLNSTSLNRITGNIQGRLPWVALGSDAQLALNQYEQIRNLLSLDSREKLKGTGAISDFESKMLAASASALGRNLSDADFKAELQKIRDIFDGKYKYLTNESDIKNVQSTATGTQTGAEDAYALYLKSIWQ